MLFVLSDNVAVYLITSGVSCFLLIWLQTLILCKTTLWCTLLAMSEEDMARPLVKDKDAPPAREGSRTKIDGAPQTDVVQRSVKTLATLPLVTAAELRDARAVTFVTILVPADFRGEGQTYDTEATEAEGDATCLCSDQGNAEHERAPQMRQARWSRRSGWSGF